MLRFLVRKPFIQLGDMAPTCPRFLVTGEFEDPLWRRSPGAVGAL